MCGTVWVVRGQGLGARTGGVWTAADALAAGFSRRQVLLRVRAGEWQRLRPGVYLDGGVDAGTDHRAWAAVLRAGGPGRAWAVGRTAARVHGLPLVDDDDACLGRHEHDQDDVAVNRPLRRTADLVPHRWSYDATDLGTLRGVPVPSLARTLWDLRLVLRSDALVCALDAALHSGQVRADELMALGAAARDARGQATFCAALARADARAESPLETLVRLVVRPALPDLESQVEVRDQTGRLLGRVDLGVREARFGVEADGGSHLGTVSLARDRARERRLGWRLERATWVETRTTPEALRDRVLEAYAEARRPSPSARASSGTRHAGVSRTR